MKILHFLLIPSLFLSLLACFGSKDAKPQTSQRLDVAKSGISIEANYDTRLDQLIPGYKMITVALTNNGFDVLKLNPLKDKWEIVDAGGKSRRAINSIRIQNPHIFGQLPSGVQNLIEYPVGINIGYSETVDLFFPANTDLRNFRGISFYSADLDQTFDAMANLDSPTAIPINKINEEAAQQAPKKAPGKKSSAGLAN